MTTTFETRTEKDLETGRKARKYGVAALLVTAMLSFCLGWFGGQAAEKNNADNLPGGLPTDGVSGPSPTDRR